MGGVDLTGMYMLCSFKIEIWSCFKFPNSSSILKGLFKKAILVDFRQLTKLTVY